MTNLNGKICKLLMKHKNLKLTSTQKTSGSYFDKPYGIRVTTNLQYKKENYGFEITFNILGIGFSWDESVCKIFESLELIIKSALITIANDEIICNCEYEISKDSLIHIMNVNFSHREINIKLEMKYQDNYEQSYLNIKNKMIEELQWIQKEFTIECKESQEEKDNDEDTNI